MKMVIVVRKDLEMGIGKIGAQCGHAAVGAYQTALLTIPETVKRWEYTGAAKIVLKIQSEDDLLNIERKAKEKGLNTCLIRDAGRTQIASGSKTVLAVGPAPVNLIDQVTGHLSLL